MALEIKSGSFRFDGPGDIVSEPENLAMLLAGLGLIGIVKRRKQPA